MAVDLQEGAAVAELADHVLIPDLVDQRRHRRVLRVGARGRLRSAADVSGAGGPPGPRKMRWQALNRCARMARRARSGSRASIAAAIATCSACTTRRRSAAWVSESVRASPTENSSG